MKSNRTKAAKTANSIGSKGPEADGASPAPAPLLMLAGSELPTRLVAPPTVIRGAKSQLVGIGIDWLRVVGPVKNRDRFEVILARYFGASEPCKGKWFYDFGVRFKNETRLMWQHSADNATLCIDVPGGALCQIEPAKLPQFIRELMTGNHATRVDLRADFKGEQVGLIDAVQDACRGGQLCGARVWKPQGEFTSSNERTAYGVNLGRRGKDGSGRYVRVYDKGLESGECRAGQWERWEIELNGDCANLALCQLAELIEPEPMMLALIFGAVDFREATGSRELDRRPRSAWWLEFLAGLQPVRLKQERGTSRLVNFAGWIRRCVAPTIGNIAKWSGQDPLAVFEYLAGDTVNQAKLKIGSIAWEYVQELIDDHIEPHNSYEV